MDGQTTTEYAILLGFLAIAIIVALSLAAWLLRRSRLAVWRRTPLMFEDELPDQAVQLHL
jgi:hypothetical protein